MNILRILDAYCWIILSTLCNSKDITTKILIGTDLETLETYSSLCFWVAITGTESPVEEKKLKAVKGEVQRIIKKKKEFWIKGKLIRGRQGLRRAGCSQQQTDVAQYKLGHWVGTALGHKKTEMK